MEPKENQRKRSLSQLLKTGQVLVSLLVIYKNSYAYILTTSQVEILPFLKYELSDETRLVFLYTHMSLHLLPFYSLQFLCLGDDVNLEHMYQHPFVWPENTYFSNMLYRTSGKAQLFFICSSEWLEGKHISYPMLFNGFILALSVTVLSYSVTSYFKDNL